MRVNKIITLIRIFLVLLYLTGQSVHAQEPVDWNKLYNKDWLVSESLILRPDRPERKTIVLYSRGKNSLMDLDKKQMRLFPDSTKIGIDTDGDSYSESWKFDGTHSIWVEGDRRPAKVMVLTDTKLVLEIPQVYEYLTTNEKEFLVARETYETNDPPIKPVSFSVRSSENKDVLVSWSIESGKDIERFEVEHSLDGKLFNSVGQVPVNKAQSSIQNYSYVHKDVELGSPQYYRLKIFDQKDLYFLSETRSLSRSGDMAVVYPNPTSGELTIEAENLEGIKFVSIHDESGKEIYTKSVSQDDNKLDVKMLNEGIYLLRIVYLNGQSKTRQVIIKK